MRGAHRAWPRPGDCARGEREEAEKGQARPAAQAGLPLPALPAAAPCPSPARAACLSHACTMLRNICPVIYEENSFRWGSARALGAL